MGASDASREGASGASVDDTGAETQTRSPLTRSSLLIPGSGLDEVRAVTFSMQVMKASYDQLMLNTALLEAIKTSIQECVATEVGNGVLASDVAVLAERAWD